VIDVGKDHVRIDSDQAKILARAIYRSVAAYIESHQDEYQAFLHEERESNNGNAKSTHRSSGTIRKAC
jgi:hypothetical protein